MKLRRQFAAKIISSITTCFFLFIFSPVQAQIFDDIGKAITGAVDKVTETTSYPQVSIRNNTPYTITGVVNYAACRSDNFSVSAGRTWTARARRGACLVTRIKGTPSGQPAQLRGTGSQSFGENKSVIDYQSTGTAFARFRIEPFSGRYRIFSLREHTAVTDTRQEKSPGFRITNRTPWPIAVSIDQVGCLNYGVIPAQIRGRPGIFKRRIGSGWYTIRAQIQPDGQDHQDDWDCIRPVAELVGDVALAAMTGGGGTAISAARIGAKQAAKEALKQAAKAATKKALRKVASFSAKQMGEYLTQTGSVTMPGQFAGYEFPFKCDRMPNYEITGGPVPIRDEDGSFYLEDGPPLTIRKLNQCGNDAMFASPKTQRSEPISVARFARPVSSVSAVSSNSGTNTTRPPTRPAVRPTPSRSPRPPQSSGIQVVTATYGGNVGARRGNATGHIARACNNRSSCTYTINYRVIGDPVPGRGKDYRVTYRCPNGSTRSASATPEAGFRKKVILRCTGSTGNSGTSTTRPPTRPAVRPTPSGSPRPPQSRGIKVVTATYGGNVGARRGNATGHIARAFNNRSSCTYTVDYRVIGDPVPGRGKDYRVTYRCPNGSTRGASATPEAGFRKKVTLYCN